MTTQDSRRCCCCWNQLTLDLCNCICVSRNAISQLEFYLECCRADGNLPCKWLFFHDIMLVNLGIDEDLLEELRPGLQNSIAEMQNFLWQHFTSFYPIDLAIYLKDTLRYISTNHGRIILSILYNEQKLSLN